MFSVIPGGCCESPNHGSPDRGALTEGTVSNGTVSTRVSAESTQTATRVSNHGDDWLTIYLGVNQSTYLFPKTTVHRNILQS